MNKPSRPDFESALLVSTWVIAACFVLSLLAWWRAMDGVAALLLTVAVLGAVSRLWGSHALGKMTVSVRCDRETVSVGQSVTWHYRIENNKALPLLWLELGQEPAKRDCMTPAGSFERRKFSPEEARYSGRESLYLHRFSLLGGMSALDWDCVWTGQRRGVYRPGALLLRSGDGFGLTQSSREMGDPAGGIFVVWPEIVEVNIEPLLKNIWTGRTDRAGWVEDTSVLRGERVYQPSDPWKRIDWRTAARSDELYVRQYETIAPQSLLFVLDSASLSDPEGAISLLGSLLLALDERGVACGLALPATKSAPAQLLRPDDPAVGREELMFALADFEAETAVSGGFDTGAIVSAAAEAGQVYMMCESRRGASASALCTALEPYGLRRLCRDGAEGLSFDALRRREAAG